MRRQWERECRETHPKTQAVAGGGAHEQCATTDQCNARIGATFEQRVRISVRSLTLAKPLKFVRASRMIERRLG